MSLKALFYPDQPFETLFIPHIYKELYFDVPYASLFEGKRDMVIVDVGANIGIVTQFLREHAKIVWALEPSAQHFEALKANKEYNGWNNVAIFNLAIADCDGEMMLHHNTVNTTMHSLTTDYKEGGEKVGAVALDTFFAMNSIGAVDFLKLDIEGGEELILPSDGFARVAPQIRAMQVSFHLPTWPRLVMRMGQLGYQTHRYAEAQDTCLFLRSETCQ